MIRFLLSALVFLASAAVGLVVAATTLDDMHIDGWSFLEVVVIFAVLQAVIAPFLFKVTRRGAAALIGGVGLLSAFVALLLTSWLSSGLSIRGTSTWVLAALIVWVVTMLATLLLPLLVTKRVVQNRRAAREV